MGSDSSVLADIFRIILILINICFVLIGLALMACGIVVKFFLGVILKSSLLTGALEDVYQGINKGQEVPKNLDFGAFTNEAGLALIIIGVIIFGISIFACCGACYKWRPFLVVFSILVIILVIGEAAATGLLASKTSPIHENARKELKNLLKVEYNCAGTNAFSATLNLLMFGMNCCGINGQDDFKTLALKYKDASVKIPPSCCKLVEEDNKKKPMECQKSPTGDNSYQTGCYDSFLNLLTSGNKWAIPIVVAVMLLQVLEVVFSAYIIRNIGKGSVGAV
ncbi:hypothetical protein LOTGIDRAFT_236635 [Lottia gigantea]|uniref:Tetraspanin n=1 Tax=Lottia gigantea TaxID=225164 RepID=V4B4H9_LOTGI|nr:hypothetical protein LOTGIDRAFT_236635 [Lottia gigantea]ESO83334.1 hypothetical protein LOTGIDRAFT_236635 [Lottia gigantea]